MSRTKTFIALVSLPGRIWNRLLNVAFSTLCGVRVRIIWSGAKLIGVDGIRFGANFMAGRGLWLEVLGNGRLRIGRNVNVSDWVHIGVIGEVVIGDGCLLGSKVLITDHGHGSQVDLSAGSPDRPNARPLHSKGPVILEDNVWLGDAVVVLPGIRIGRNAIVGANSVVTRDIPSNTVWAGSPATQIWPKSQ
jgi:lipopolysaccharide O-acetyltransferase